MEQATDREIVEGIGRGERWAAERLYDRVHASVERTLRRLLRDDADRDDLMQASFERIIRVLSQPTPREISDLGAWASAVSAHVALDALRRRGRERRLFRSEPAMETFHAGVSNPEQSAQSRWTVERTQGVLARMRPAYAEALLLHDVLGYGLAEIADMTGLSVAAAQSRLVRGRKDFLRRAQAIRSQR